MFEITTHCITVSISPFDISRVQTAIRECWHLNVHPRLFVLSSTYHWMVSMYFAVQTSLILLQQPRLTDWCRNVSFSPTVRCIVSSRYIVMSSSKRDTCWLVRVSVHLRILWNADVQSERVSSSSRDSEAGSFSRSSSERDGTRERVSTIGCLMPHLPVIYEAVLCWAGICWKKWIQIFGHRGIRTLR